MLLIKFYLNIILVALKPDANYKYTEYKKIYSF